MILTGEQIEQEGIVIDAVAEGRRSTTYDATIGDFILDGRLLEKDVYWLEPRGIVWVVSNETFKFGAQHSGLATLRTTLTHSGILALNVGVIDPCWEGPLATALVNFSASSVPLKCGQPFFRVLVMNHATPDLLEHVKEERLQYLAKRVAGSRHFSSTFLDMHALVDQVATKVFGLPKLVVTVGVVGLFLAMISMVVPVGYSVWTDQSETAASFTDLERRVQDLEKQLEEAQIAPPPPRGDPMREAPEQPSPSRAGSDQGGA